MDAEAGLLYGHDMQMGDDPVHHTVYADNYTVPEGILAEQVGAVIDPVCYACAALYELVNVTRSMRAVDNGEVHAWCSIYDSSVNMESKHPRYLSMDVSCALRERKILLLRGKEV